MFYIKHTIIFAVLCAVAAVCDENIVSTSHGKISGKVFFSLYKHEEYFGFMGIPYAAPPVGDLRFLPPQPLSPWEDVLVATKEKKACVQFNNNIKKGQPMGFYGTENCLYLDIFTPATDDKKRAVIFFIYNEYFLNSYNKTKDYQPDFFIEEDVVVVTISHRLSAFGFLSLEDDKLWGNSGLKDIVAGLEWVKDNIEHFGGDPNQITLMGFQGGAAVVDLLLHSKKKYLFKSAILQSGNAWTTGVLQENVRDRAFELAKLFNKHPASSEDVLKEMNAIPAINITSRDSHASPSDYFKETQRSVASFAPIVEKYPEGLIVDYPENSTEINTPVLIGFNSREGLEASLHYLIEPRYITFLKKDFPLLMPRRVNFAFDPLQQPFIDAIEEVKDFYFNRKINLKSVKDFVTYIGDAITAYSTDYAAKTYAKISSAPVYYYHFNYSSDLNENKNNIIKLSTDEDAIWGAAMGDELCYLFKCPDLDQIYLKHNETKSEERNVQIKLVKLWTNFAKYGNPTPQSDITLDGLNWPTFTAEHKQYLHINKHMKIQQELYKNNFQFWDEFFAKWEQRAVNGIISESMNKKDEL